MTLWQKWEKPRKVLYLLALFGILGFAVYKDEQAKALRDQQFAAGQRCITTYGAKP